MMLRPEALEGHLAKTIAPLYVIASDEHLLATRSAAPRARMATPSAMC
jgi:DNA polymerase-3 subunit delta